ncbi:hypothetical protein GLAREA_02967 [Glarea lozoyensis ATCC 20868]|uniref:PLAC8 family protein n=1 Tax=Glarea lozoyensis (strain ATCC 20868 / MF5171) TaxID=1116229 RepID=S3DKG7_GLAL2|nr:uncharacterized protein GLAREA_02967 [Glarea lozoyensis ATCC 20868]EPE27053.1 hypothetical protein GLAREA_02967 [Glarea lozoyensis ATCC 20868]
MEPPSINHAPFHNAPSMKNTLSTVGTLTKVSANLSHRNSLTTTTTTATPLQTTPPRKHNVLTKEPKNNVPSLDGSRIPPRAAVPYTTAGADDSETYPHWMAGFCIEPRGDALTCFQAVFCPCFLYGKTQWRIKRFSRGQNGFDDAWETSEGCNGYCLGCLGVRIVFPLFSFVPIMMLRTSVRGVYGIAGNNADDCLISFFCQPCVLAQSDREVRAREGSHGLRTDRSYKRYKRSIDNHPPGLNPPMTYASPPAQIDTIPGNSQRGTHEIGFLSEQSPASANVVVQPVVPPTKADGGGKSTISTLSGFLNKMRGKRRSKLSSAHLSDGDEDGEELLGHQEPNTREKLPQSWTAGSHRANNTEQEEKQPVSDDKLQNREVVIVETSNGQHMLKCRNHQKSTSGSYQRVEQQSWLETQTSADLASDSGARSVADHTLQHRLSQCESVDSSETVQQHPLNDCRPFTLATSQTTSIAQHDRPNSSSKTTTNIHGPGEKQALLVCENSNVTELQQKISKFRQTHTLTVCEDISKPTIDESTTTEAGNTTSAQPNVTETHGGNDQHNLSDCVSIGPALEVSHTLAIYEESNLSAAQQQNVSSCHELIQCSSAISQQNKSEQHDLAGCVDIVTQKPANDHTLETCERKNQLQHLKIASHHSIEECTSGTSFDIVAQHEMAECDVDTDLSSPKRHTLIECESDNQTSRSIQPVSHVLTGCESKDTVVITSQHGLKDCKFESGISTPVGHSLLSCEGKNQKQIKEAQSLTEMNLLIGDITEKSGFGQNMSEGSNDPVGFKARAMGVLNDIVPTSGKNNKGRPPINRLSSCPNPSSDFSPPAEGVTSNHQAENAQLTNRGEETISFDHQNKVRYGNGKSLSFEQQESTGSGSIKFKTGTRREMKRIRSEEVLKDKAEQKSKKSELARKMVESLEEEEFINQISLAQNTPERPNTVGPGHIKSPTRAKLGMRRTKSDYGQTALSDDEEEEEMSGVLVAHDNKPNPGSGLTSFFAKLTGKGSA